MKRLSWDEYFIGIMNAVAERSSCDRGKVGSVIVRNKRILATGYAGSPAGTKHCDEAGHEFMEVLKADGTTSQHCIRTTHAEQNAIVHAARFGSSLENGTLYCIMTPCYACAKMIINAGITRVVAVKDYHAGDRSKEIFQEAGVKFELLHEEVTSYKNNSSKKQKAKR
jgi:dCMP deaminase